MREALQIVNNLYALTLVGTLLAMLTLRIVTGTFTLQINLIGEYRTAVERATRNCLFAPEVAMALESNLERRLRLFQAGAVLAPHDPSLLIRPTVEEADQLMRTLSALPKCCSDLRVSQLRCNLRKLKKV